jgi:hypothetical protein
LPSPPSNVNEVPRTSIPPNIHERRFDENRRSPSPINDLRRPGSKTIVIASHAIVSQAASGIGAHHHDPVLLYASRI